MGHSGSRHMFGSFTYEKECTAIKEVMSKKVEGLKAKINEREGRIVKIRKEYDISDVDMINLLTQAAQGVHQNAKMSYTISSQAASGSDSQEERLIGAGVVQNLLTERTLIEDEQASVKQMERVIRNLKPLQKITENGTLYMQTGFELSDTELEFLGF